MKRYWRRLSGPLLDRLDLQLQLESPTQDSLREMLEEHHGAMDQDHLPATIAAARQQMQKRNPNGCCNRDLSISELKRHGEIRSETFASWEQVMGLRRYSLRSGLKLLKVSRTIADLECQQEVSVQHLATALCFRSFDGQTQHGSTLSSTG